MYAAMFPATVGALDEQYVLAIDQIKRLAVQDVGCLEFFLVGKFGDVLQSPTGNQKKISCAGKRRLITGRHRHRGRRSGIQRIRCRWCRYGVRIVTVRRGREQCADASHGALT